jgi:hypothetical protein
MKRRDFLQSTLAVTGLTSLNLRAAEPVASPPAREYYELRRYHLRRGPSQKRFDDYARDAAIPAMNRLGLGPIGVFHVMTGPDSPSAYVLIPYASPEQFATASGRLAADAEYLKAGADFINTPATDPAYIRVESSLMVAFEGMPKLEVPAAAKDRQPRIFELRIYESHSKKANRKKIEMFNVGEIALFRRTGLTPVFFGETLVGARLPNLTYLLVFENMAARDKNWSTFAGDPEWKKLSTTPGYTDPEIVSNISNCFLRPAPYSQI